MGSGALLFHWIGVGLRTNWILFSHASKHLETDIAADPVQYKVSSLGVTLGKIFWLGVTVDFALFSGRQFLRTYVGEVRKVWFGKSRLEDYFFRKFGSMDAFVSIFLQKLDPA